MFHVKRTADRTEPSGTFGSRSVPSRCSSTGIGGSLDVSRETSALKVFNAAP